MRHFLAPILVCFHLAIGGSTVIHADDLSSSLNQATHLLQGDKGKTVSQVKADLKDKSKSEVKTYFGRAPDFAKDDSSWAYKGSYYDADSEKTMIQVHLSFYDDKVITIVFTSY